MSRQGTSALPAVPDAARWVDDHGDSLYRFAMLRVRDPQLAEDLVQEALLAAMSARKRFSGAASVRTWLIAILRHKIIDHLRASSRHQLGVDERDDVGEAFFDRRGLWKEGPANWSVDPQRILEQDEFRNALQQCVQKLPPRAAEAFCLREIEDMESDEVCKVLGISPNNLWTQLHRARMLLRRCLEKTWFGRQGLP